jgi:hypothetical protein
MESKEIHFFVVPLRFIIFFFYPGCCGLIVGFFMKDNTTFKVPFGFIFFFYPCCSDMLFVLRKDPWLVIFIGVGTGKLSIN